MTVASWFHVQNRPSSAPRHRRIRTLTAIATASALIIPLIIGTGSAQAATKAAPRPPATPTIIKTSVSRWVLPDTGGSITVRIQTRNATVCWFEGTSGIQISAVHQSCSSGLAQIAARIAPDHTLQIEHLRIEIFATNKAGVAATAYIYLLEQALAPLAVTTTTLPLANVNTHYLTRLTAKGGLVPYTWKLAAGELPLGLSLSPSGILFGTPTIPGTETISVTLADASRPTPLTAAAQLTLTIVPNRLTITTQTLPAGATESLYTTTLAATGGVAPYTWKQLTGQLPPGFTLAPTGVLTGTPTAGGAFRFSVQITDSATPTPHTATASFTITVTTPTLKFITLSLPKATVGSSYTTTLVAKGGIPPYIWDVNSGQLPDGVALSSAGVLSGTPTDADTYAIDIHLSDSSSTPQTIVKVFNLVVAAVPLTITAQKLPGAAINTTYNGIMVATGGITPYSWIVSSGALPLGVTLSSTGTLTGTPTQAGKFKVWIKVTDSSPTPQTAKHKYILNVTPAPLVISTTALPGVTVGSPYVATLAAQGGITPYTWSVPQKQLPRGITMSSAGNLTGVVPTGTPAGTYPITVSATDSSNPKQQPVTAPFALVVGNNVPYWSGYVQTGKFISVTGTFVIPTVAAGQADVSPAAVSEWVGLDGTTTGLSIQAGVDEAYSSPAGPSCSTSPPARSYCNYSWWGVSGVITPIAMTVTPGDSITVTIFQILGDNWAITLDDNTTGQDFRVETAYTGLGTTAEYVVDAPTSVYVPPGNILTTTTTVAGTPSTTATTSATSATEPVVVLGAYTPAIQFTNLHALGGGSKPAAVLLLQGGVQVSTPSTFENAGFTVAYGSIVPAAP